MVAVEQRPAPFDRPTPNGRDGESKGPSPPASTTMPQHSGHDWASGCRVTLQTTLGEEVTGDVFAFDRLTNCLTLIEEGDGPGLVHFRVLKATFIKEVVSAQRHASPAPLHLPSVDLTEGLRREERALEVPLMPTELPASQAPLAANGGPWTQTASPVENPVCEDPGWATRPTQCKVDSAPERAASLEGPLAAAAVQQPAPDCLQPSSPKSLAPRPVGDIPDAGSLSHGKVPDGSPGPELPAACTNGQEHSSRLSPPKQATSNPQAPSWSAVARPWGQGSTVGDALSKANAGLGLPPPKAGAPVDVSAGADVAGGMGANRMKPVSGSTPVPSPGLPTLRGRWSKGKPNIPQDP